jgi:hypothetical protein
MPIQTHNIAKFFALTVLLFAGQAMAQNNDSLLNFKFKHMSNVNVSETPASLDTDMQTSDPLGLNKINSIKFAQYDATWTYPWETKNMSIDLGVTLRHLTGVNAATEGLDNVHFKETLPLLHASALYNFSFKGLSAGVEGSHLNSEVSQVFDYRAKVSYEWRNGFGLQGGWQHQKFSLDKSADNSADYEVNGPFIDFYLNF